MEFLRGLSPDVAAFVATAGISFFPTIVLYCIPHSSLGIRPPSGGPQHSHTHAHRHDHDDQDGPGLLQGFLLAFAADKLMRAHTAFVEDGKGKKSDGDGAVKDGVSLQSGAYLNLAADAMHNFTDGVALGASFASSTAVGLATSLSVLVHELPHEIGDFTILVQNGCSPSRAILLQFATATFAMMGTAVGIRFSQYEGVSYQLLAVVSGGFVYIAALTVLPELLKRSTTFQTLVEVLGFCAGVAIMVWVAQLEHHEGSLAGHTAHGHDHDHTHDHHMSMEHAGAHHHHEHAHAHEHEHHHDGHAH